MAADDNLQHVETFGVHRLDSPRGDANRGTWASALGTVAVLLGLLMTVSHATEWMKQSVIQAATPASRQLPPAQCRPDELEEEKLTVAECEHMVARVQVYVLTAPSWFPAARSVLSVIGTFVAFSSVLIGAALVNMRDWAPRLATGVFSILLLIDGGGFLAAVNAGPVIRSEYLWPSLIWFVLHLIMLVACIAVFQNERTELSARAA